MRRARPPVRTQSGARFSNQAGFCSERGAIRQLIRRACLASSKAIRVSCRSQIPIGRVGSNVRCRPAHAVPTQQRECRLTPEPIIESLSAAGQQRALNVAIAQRWGDFQKLPSIHIVISSAAIGVRAVASESLSCAPRSAAPFVCDGPGRSRNPPLSSCI